jgi:hypothetical protein
MTVPRVWVVLLAAWAATPVRAQVPLPEQKRGPVVARAWWQVAKEAARPGLAELTYTVTVEGSPLLEVGPVTLGDATGAWEASPNQFCWLEGDRLTQTEVIELRQTKPGELRPPSITVRFRDGPKAAWEEVEWVDLDRPSYQLTPEALPLDPERLLAWRLGAAAVGGALLVVLGLLGWRVLKPKPPPPPTPEQTTLQELDRLEGLAGAERSEWYHTRLSYVLRRYLADRFALKATQQTTAEFLASVQEMPQLAGEPQELLREFLERCDLAKFAPVSGSAEECRQSTALARTLVQRLAELAAQTKAGKPR